jgi:uncharacterized membrane protein
LDTTAHNVERVELDRLFSLPAHPLLVHIPVMCVPIAAVGAVLIALHPGWRRVYGPLVALFAAVGGFGAVLAASSGESLQEQVRGNRQLVRDHAEMGEAARNVSLLLFILVVALVGLDIYQRRHRSADHTSTTATDRSTTVITKTSSRSGIPAWVSPVVAGLTVLAAIGGTYTMVAAGHSGAKAVWQDVATTGAPATASPAVVSTSTTTPAPTTSR